MKNSKFVYRIIVFFILIVLFFLYWLLETNIVYTFYGYIYFAAPFVIIFLLFTELFLYKTYLFELKNIFLFTSLIFFFGSTLVRSVFEIDVFQLDSLVVENFDPKLLDKASLIILISIITIYLVARNAFEIVSPKFIFNHFFFRLGKKLMTFSIPFVFLQYLFEFYYIFKNGYLAIYSIGLNNIDYPLPFLRFSYYFFFIGYFLVVISNCSYVIFKKYSYIFLFFALLNSLKGGRAEIMIPICYFLWISNLIYGKRLQIKKIIYLFLLVLLSANFLSQFRTDNDSLPISKIFYSVIASQGRSTQTFALYLKNSEELDNLENCFIIANLAVPIINFQHPEAYNQGQNIESVKYSKNFKLIITYFLNESYYLAGGGIGGTYIAELYQFGIIGVIFFSLIFGTYLRYHKFFFNIPYIKFISFFLFSHIFIISRAEYFPNTYILIKYILIYVAIYVLLIIINKKIIYNNAKYPKI